MKIFRAGFPIGFCKNYEPHEQHIWNPKKEIPTQGYWCPGTVGEEPADGEDQLP